MTQISEIRGKSADELKDMALSLKKELFNLRFQVASGEQPNTARFRTVRRDIARVKTLLNEPADLTAKLTSATKKAAAPANAKKSTKKQASGE